MSLPECYLEEFLEKLLEKIALKRWQQEKGMRQAKLLIGEQPSKPWLAKVRKLERKVRKAAIGWLKGHWRVNYHLSKLGLSRTVDCRWCHVKEKRWSTSHSNVFPAGGTFELTGG